MSPFSHLLHDLRMRHDIRQAELADVLGYEQSYISALEVGLKGPPTQDFIERLIAAVPLSPVEQHELRAAAEASQRKLVLDSDTPQDVYWLVKDLRDQVHSLSPTQVRMMRDLLRLRLEGEEVRREPARRIRRRQKTKAEATM